MRTDEKHIRARSAILYKGNPKTALFLSITVFSGWMRFLSVQKTRLARRARNGRCWHALEFETPQLRGDLNRARRRCRASMLRGRETVRADHLLRTDEKHIRAQ
ncbi:MAG: hypothetical protein EPO19_17295 [Betaproteobacteria bacterium]|nr:MAG: hypothetical protein EPO19_17295 [Betaproteobacteria bacterium]